MSSPTPGVASSAADPFRVAHTRTATGVEVRLGGTLSFDQGALLWETLRAARGDEKSDNVRFDISSVDAVDGGAMALLVQTKWDVEASGGRCEIVGATGVVQKVLALYERTRQPAQRAAVPTPPASALARVGAVAFDTLGEVQQVFAFVGSMVLSFGGVLRRPRTGNWRECARVVSRVGADAVPIVVLINFLLGFVMAFQSAVQLRQFGANIFVADLVGLAIVRELGPLMTAIIVCGRSGAAFAAELGTMKVSEEIDALRTLGFGPLRYLVLPRLVGLLIAAPILTLLGDVVGMLGGLLVGITSLDLTVSGYLLETRQALHAWDVLQGLVKSVVFAMAIGIVSCQQGLATVGGAEGVGRRTTSAVVASLFALILVDACFTLVFHALHL